VEEIGRDPGLCASAILSCDPHILTDAAEDIRSLANPLVAGEFGLRFYAGVPLQTSDGYNLGTLCVIDQEARPVDQEQINDLKDLATVVMDQLELRMAARRAVSQAQILTREIDHRVMNSLQFISSMLAMQGRASAVPEAANQLEIAATRVAAVARVHRHFYLDEAAEEVSCLTYLRRLCGDLSGILVRPIEVDGDEGSVPTTTIQPIGLIVNELVVNAAKHGAGKIQVTFTLKGNCAISVCDQGTGVARGFEPQSSSAGLGMKVVGVLAKQLGGEFSAGPNPAGRGACFVVTFPCQ
jgi:two-component sensor histidine kinase